jgi:hypothetical protein
MDTGVRRSKPNSPNARPSCANSLVVCSCSNVWICAIEGQAAPAHRFCQLPHAPPITTATRKAAPSPRERRRQSSRSQSVFEASGSPGRGCARTITDPYSLRGSWGRTRPYHADGCKGDANRWYPSEASWVSGANSTADRVLDPIRPRGEAHPNVGPPHFFDTLPEERATMTGRLGAPGVERARWACRTDDARVSRGRSGSRS